MKIREDFLLSIISGKNIVVPTGRKAVDFNGMITLNNTGAYLWKLLESDRSEDELVACILKDYPEAEEAFARDCVRDFVNQLKEAGCLE